MLLMLFGDSYFSPQPDSVVDLQNKKILLSGDSTITSQACRPDPISDKLFTSTEILAGYSATNIAAGGNTINQQKTAWNNLSNKTDFDIIIIQIGLNDMSTPIATTISAYQSYVNLISGTKKPNAKIYISCMLPCKQRFIDYGVTSGQANWSALNQAIMGDGATPITGVDKRNNYHVALLDDGNGNLASAYDCGDHIHENQAGADIIIQGFRNMIF